jgi:nucleotidyltransferase substrate binding protein (TIGR01987 family)
MTKFESLHEDFQNALARFAEVLREKKTDIVRDSAIQRFEIVFELAWKITKAFLEERHNITCVSPRNCFREAFRVGLIEYDAYFIEMTKIRNYTAHTYHEAFAEKIYQGLPRALEEFQKLQIALSKDIE